MSKIFEKFSHKMLNLIALTAPNSSRAIVNLKALILKLVQRLPKIQSASFLK